MQKRIVRNAVASTLLVSSLMLPLVSCPQEYDSGKSRVNEIKFDLAGEKDTLKGNTEEDTIVAKIFEVARDRGSGVFLNSMEIIYGYSIVETEDIFPKSSWKKTLKKEASQGNISFPVISEAMMEMTLEKTGDEWGFCLTEKGITIKYGNDPENAMDIELLQGNPEINLKYAMDEKRTRVYRSNVKDDEFSWISACCERISQDNVPCQHLVLAFTNLYPSNIEEVEVIASVLKLPEGWKAIDERSFLGNSSSEGLTPSAYFVAEDASGNRYEIMMLGYTYIEENIRNNVQVVIKDRNGQIFEVK